MDNTTVSQRRSSWFSRLIVCSLLVASLGYLAIDGHQTKINLLFAGDVFGKPLGEIEDSITWMHGWPIAFYVRNSLDTVKINSTPGITDIYGSASFSPWPFDNSPTLAFSWVGLVLDIAFAFAITIATWHSLAALTNQPIQFGIRTLMTVVTLVAILAAFNAFNSRYLKRIEIGARLPGTPLTPPGMRVRTRRFALTCKRFPILFQIKQTLLFQVFVAQCSLDRCRHGKTPRALAAHR